MLSKLGLLVVGALALLSEPVVGNRPHPKKAWGLKRFQNLITFGDSYTDENRLSYFISHEGKAPPPGTLLGESFSTASGGRIWARYVVQYFGSYTPNKWIPRLQLYDYAVAGAVCSNVITPRALGPTSLLIPAVKEYEIPAFLADTKARRNGTAQPYFTPPRTSANTLYAIWIGTNDLGEAAFITDSEVNGTSLTDYTNCVFEQFDALYKAGGRYFVLINNAPLHLARMYANASIGGVGVEGQFWSDKAPINQTLVAEKMRQYVTTVNNVYRYQLPYEALVANRYPGAHVALFDAYSLFEDIYRHPSGFLNGTVVPLNVEGVENRCNSTGGDCVRVPADEADSYLWYDTLHPSEQTERVIAREFTALAAGNGKYATYY